MPAAFEVSDIDGGNGVDAGVVFRTMQDLEVLPSVRSSDATPSLAEARAALDGRAFTDGSGITVVSVG